MVKKNRVPMKNMGITRPYVDQAMKTTSFLSDFKKPEGTWGPHGPVLRLCNSHKI